MILRNKSNALPDPIVTKYHGDDYKAEISLSYDEKDNSLRVDLIIEVDDYYYDEYDPGSIEPGTYHFFDAPIPTNELDSIRNRYNEICKLLNKCNRAVDVFIIPYQYGWDY